MIGDGLGHGVSLRMDENRLLMLTFPMHSSASPLHGLARAGTCAVLLLKNIAWGKKNPSLRSQELELGGLCFSNLVCLCTDKRMVFGYMHTWLSLPGP